MFISLVGMYDLTYIVTPPLALSAVFLFLLKPLKLLRGAVELSLKFVSWRQIICGSWFCMIILSSSCFF